MRRCLQSLLLLCCALPAWNTAVAQAPAFELKVERAEEANGGKAWHIAASATVAAAPAAVWRVLTDYDHLADFVPDLKSARVLSRDGNDVVVDQLGAAHFLFFSHAIHLVVRVHEQPPDRIDVTEIEGDMQVYRSSWTLRPAPGGGTMVGYNAGMEPKFYVPAMVGGGIVRRDAARMMAAVLARLEREPRQPLSQPISAPAAQE